MDRITHIIDLASSNPSPEHNSLVSAYCSCLTTEEASNLLLQCVSSHLREARNAVLRKVRSDISNCFTGNHTKLIKGLLGMISHPSARVRQSSGFCLSQLCGITPTSIRNDIEKTLISSRYIGIRRRAYKCISNCDEVPFELVSEAWEKFQDWECGWLIVKEFPCEYLIEKRQSLVQTLSEGWVISRLYLRIGETAPEYLEELRGIDQISYCYVLAKLNHSLDDNTARKIVDESVLDERFGLLIWSLGRLKKWKTLEYVETILPGIQERKIDLYKAKYGIK